LKKIVIGVFLFVFGLSVAARATGYYVPVTHQQELRNHPFKRPWDNEERRHHEEERRRRDEERRHHEEERRRRDEEQRRHEEQRRQDEERRRHEGEQRRQDKERRRHEGEQRRQDEERRRHEEERRRQDEERRRHEGEQRRRDEERRRHEEERRRQDEEQRRHEEERRRQDEEQRRHEEERRRREAKPRRLAPKPPQARPFHLVPRHESQGEQSARQILRKTAKLLTRAQRAAKLGHYRYGLGRAFAHQEEAWTLYSGGWYDRAIVHSLYARKIARNIITENQPGRSRRPRHYPVYDDPLDQELSINITDDNVALELRINLN
jgi:hypothetical protein